MTASTKIWNFGDRLEAPAQSSDGTNTFSPHGESAMVTNQEEKGASVTGVIKAATAIGFATLASPAFAQAEGVVQGFFEGVNGMFRAGGVAAVTVAIIIAGYQIAFAHKRFTDVAPVLIGGFLIGAAAILAPWLLGLAGAGA